MKTYMLLLMIITLISGQQIYGMEKIIPSSTQTRKQIPTYKTSATILQQLLAAAHWGKLEIIKKTISSQPELINCIVQDESTMLHIVCKKNHLPIVQYLLAMEANITLKDIDSRLAHNVAALSGNKESFELIEQHAKKMNISLPALTLHESISLRDKEKLENYLKNNGSPDTKGFSGFSLLHCAVYSKDLEIVKLLISANAKMDTQDRFLATPLHRAAQKGLPSITNFLIKSGAKNNFQDIFQLTPLHWAARNGHHEVGKLLIDSGAILDSLGTQNWTALHFAAFHNHIRIAQLFIDAKANIEALTTNLFTPVHLAVLKSNMAIAKLLLDCGANINAQDHDHATPLHHAAKNKDGDLINFLLSYGATWIVKNSSLPKS